MFGTVPKSNRETNNVTLSEQFQSTIKKKQIISQCQIGSKAQLKNEKTNNATLSEQF